VGDPEPFGIDRTASPELAVAHFAGGRRALPPAAARGHGVDVMQQDKRAGGPGVDAVRAPRVSRVRRAIRATGEVSNRERASWRRGRAADELRLDAGGARQAGEEARRRRSSPGGFVVSIAR
jgi:hypothetical protein